MKRIFFLLAVSFLLFSCARVGSPDGGAKDSLAPTFLRANIDTTRVNVSQNLRELRLDFDEYVMLKEVNKNLIISPEIKKIKKIIPSNLANKYILIQWEDSLKANTTYNFNFGNAIADNNEGNILPYFNFAFSTGPNFPDQLFVSGTVTDGMAFQKKNAVPQENKMVVGLYQADENTDFKKKPNYITKADEENYFEINYLKKGDFYLLAFEDDNQNSIYDPGKEKVGFLQEKISLDSLSRRGVKLKVFPSKKKVKYIESKAINGGLLMTFEGHPEQVELHSISEALQEYKVTHRPKSDSVQVWFGTAGNNLSKNLLTPLKLSYLADQKSDTVQVSYKALKQELLLANKGGNLLAPGTAFKISATLALQRINSEKWTLESDSVAQDFTAKISEKNPFEIWINASFKPGQKYVLTIPKQTVSSYYAQNDKSSYQFEFEADKAENYGFFKLKILNKPKHAFWVELLDEKGEIGYSQFSKDAEISFAHLKPGTYAVRMKVDHNGNGYWDEADFENKILAEEVFLFHKTIEIRPLWTIEENWELQ